MSPSTASCQLAALSLSESKQETPEPACMSRLEVRAIWPLSMQMACSSGADQQHGLDMGHEGQVQVKPGQIGGCLLRLRAA